MSGVERSRQEKEEKNAKNRARAADKRARIQAILQKPERDRSIAEQTLIDKTLLQTQKKNERARRRAGEQCRAFNVILKKPEALRTESEQAFVDQQLNRKLRKVEGDKLRRMRGKFGDESKFQQAPLPKGHHLQRINYTVMTAAVLQNQQFEDASTEDDGDRKALPSKSSEQSTQTSRSKLPPPSGARPYRPTPQQWHPSYGAALSRRLQRDAHRPSYASSGAPNGSNGSFLSTRGGYYSTPHPSLLMPSLSPWITAMNDDRAPAYYRGYQGEQVRMGIESVRSIVTNTSGVMTFPQNHVGAGRLSSRGSFDHSQSNRQEAPAPAFGISPLRSDLTAHHHRNPDEVPSRVHRHHHS